MAMGGAQVNEHVGVVAFQTLRSGLDTHLSLHAPGFESRRQPLINLFQIEARPAERVDSYSGLLEELESRLVVWPEINEADLSGYRTLVEDGGLDLNADEWLARIDEVEGLLGRPQGPPPPPPPPAVTVSMPRMEQIDLLGQRFKELDRSFVKTFLKALGQDLTSNEDINDNAALPCNMINRFCQDLSYALQNGFILFKENIQTHIRENPDVFTSLNLTEVNIVQHVVRLLMNRDLSGREKKYFFSPLNKLAREFEDA